ncbi:tetratricopeptide (TPR) repeat protein [Parabacteroides sp. PF5-5]|uniref:tetratricopeptide repeat protein n=1 Tax=unclassified Parabacteroides TaxID=2649774 RepID=UPI002475EC2D|nr:MULTISPECIES: tetratricopeptide repeat protein [unclassified Parabacteroides]MDH6303459.1 tetratricopeptide (TPR) repeat protein [Parabacteroides sp. PH5-39]MDH6314781.1 tetratricopeptide (TPR) repeat protein [Parabacteroides sp. PF5-13]MDH6318118.1 tetratricopeptide (TPR) repeat protein [Parabacteroides sp. PH5-13]MDH6321950.1 tetratricopeptide (TPR) repeat protein [Parabacteroides sp. PH5-8]MDH6326074.1 tetratricopeptide (TPR) repeat protein [Parabacteroides sp. PH5-41]
MLKQRKTLVLIVLFGLLSGSFAVDAADSKQQRKFDYFYFEGLNLKNAGKYDAAFDAFLHCLSVDSTAAPVLYELSSFYMQLEQPQKAIEMLQRAVNHDPDNFTYKMSLATLSRNMGMFGEAVEIFEELVKKYPEKTELNFYLADVLTQQGEIGKAIEAYDALESSVGMNDGLSMQKYKMYMLLEEPGKAFEEMEKLAAKFPMEARYQIMIGDLYLEKGEKEKAYQSYQKAYEIDPKNPYYVVSMANYYEAINDRVAAETQIRNALVNENLDVETKVSILSRYIIRLQQTQQDTGSANTLFETLLEQHPEETELKLMYGTLLVAQGKKEEAKFQFQLVTEMEPENEAAWQRLLELFLQSQDMPEVIRVCNRCMELFPDAPEYYFYLGVAHYQEENYPDALMAYQKGLEVIPAENTPLKSDFYGQIGDLNHQMGQMDKAFEAYDEALKYNEKNIVVLNNYAYFLSLSSKDLKKAERMSAQTIKLEPGNATYLDTYAWIFFKQGNYTLAKFYIESALEKDTTNSSELVDHYGDILYMSGEKEKALEQWNKAKEMGKTDEVLDRKIKEETYIEIENE